MLDFKSDLGKFVIGNIFNSTVFVQKFLIYLYRSCFKLIVKLNVIKVDYGVWITIAQVNTLVPVINIVIRTAVRFDYSQVIRSGVSAERYSHFAVFVQLEICR